MKNIGIIIALFAFSSTLFAQNEAFDKANNHYKNGAFSEAISIYDSLYKTDNVSFELLFNLGNAYFKNDQIAKAILYYERAKLIEPNHEDLLYNLDIANNKIADKIEEIPLFLPIQIWQKTIHIFNDKEWTYINISVWLLFLFLVWYYLISSNITLKKIGFYGALLMLILSIGSGMAGYSNHQQIKAKNTAIIFTPTVNVKSSPDQNSNTLFVIHSGTKIKIIENIGEWHQVKIANGNQGWIHEKDFEKI